MKGGRTMKCEKCGGKMYKVGLAPKLGRRSLGKQYFKMQCRNINCEKFGEIKYVKPRELKN